jgi:hypothetical protein
MCSGVKVGLNNHVCVNNNFCISPKKNEIFETCERTHVSNPPPPHMGKPPSCPIPKRLLVDGTISRHNTKTGGTDKWDVFCMKNGDERQGKWSDILNENVLRWLCRGVIPKNYLSCVHDGSHVTIVAVRKEPSKLRSGKPVPNVSGVCTMRLRKSGDVFITLMCVPEIEKGLGSILLRFIMRRVGKTSKIFCRAIPKSVPFYRKMGFMCVNKSNANGVRQHDNGQSGLLMCHKSTSTTKFLGSS